MVFKYGLLSDYQLKKKNVLLSGKEESYLSMYQLIFSVCIKAVQPWKEQGLQVYLSGTCRPGLPAFHIKGIKLQKAGFSQKPPLSPTKWELDKPG